MKTEEWQRRRCAFNHDWLKNQFMPALAKCINVIDRRVLDEAFLPSFADRLRAEWGPHRLEALTLLRCFETEMSPSRLFDRPPLASCPRPVLNWLLTLVDQLWANREPVRQWTTEALEKLEAANRAYSEVVEALNRTEGMLTAEALCVHRRLFVEFQARCQELGRAISGFPCEIKAA